MDCSVNRVTTDDIETIARLFNSYRQFYGQDSDLEAARAFLAERLENNDSIVFIARGGHSGDGLGFAQLYPSFSSVAMQRIWVLNDLFVSESCRRQGVGQKLLHAVAEFAESSGAVRVDLATAKDNMAAKELYDGNGYRLDEVFDHFKLTLPQN